MRNASQEDVFWVGNDGAVHTTFANFQINNGQFATLRLSEPNLAPPGASVTAVMRNANQEDVFWVGNDSAVSATSQVNNSPFLPLPLGQATLDSLNFDLPFAQIWR